ncbi:MAG: DedA family protein [Bacillaceae bacterium]|nr:DedA family protein [Bacillaceae bacterium]
MLQLLGDSISRYGYWALFFVFYLGLIGFPVPEETLLVFSGFLVHTGHLDYVTTITVSYLGTISAMTTAYLIGRFLGYPFIMRYGRRLGMSREVIQKTETWFNRVGKFAIPIGYFIPGVRQFTAYFAGMSHLTFRSFALFAYTGGLVWSITFVTLGRVLGANWKPVFTFVSSYIAVIAGGILILILMVYVYRYWKKQVHHK